MSENKLTAVSSNESLTIRIFSDGHIRKFGSYSHVAVPDVSYNDLMFIIKSANTALKNMSMLSPSPIEAADVFGAWYPKIKPPVSVSGSLKKAFHLRK